jgi:hypothetical protein
VPPAETEDGGPRFRSEGSAFKGDRKQGAGTGPFDEEWVKVLETCSVPGGAVTFHRGPGALKELDRDGCQ